MTEIVMLPPGNNATLPRNTATAINSQIPLVMSGKNSFHGLEAVSAALDRLHRLAVAIRQSSVENRKDALSMKMWETEEISHLKNCIYNFIWGRFPAARESLIKQLTAAICFYRHRLIYQPRHNQKLADKKRIKSGHNSTGFLLDAPMKTVQLEELIGTPEITTRQGINPLAMSKTAASIPNSQLRGIALRLNRLEPSVISVGSAVEGDMLQYPDPPQFAKDAKHHPCPYCSEPLPTSKLDMKRKRNMNFWRLVH
jgi:hypothetical protein